MAGDLADWAEKIQEETYEFWKTNYEHWKPGFQVWYGPVDASKDVVILGIQPGGDESSFEKDRSRFEAGDFSMSSEHHYSTANFDLAREMRKVLTEKIIEQSVKTNLNFFRAPDQQRWKSGLKPMSRKEIELFCFQRVNELVEKLNPELIIAEGTASVYDDLQSHWGFTTDSEKKHEIAEGREERLVCIGHTDDFDVVGLKHPSSGHGLGEEQYQVMARTIQAVYP